MSEPSTAEKVCPFCAETIKAAAIRCRYCQSDLVDVEQPGAAAVQEPAAPVLVEDRGDEVDAALPPPPAPVEVREPRDWSFLDGARLLGLLVGLCLLLGIATGVGWYRSSNPAEGKAPDGVITSAEARDAGLQQATQLTQQVLSYDWKTLDADIKASEAVLAPSFRGEYTKAMAGVKDQTVKNQVKLTASAVATSIVSASENKVVALVFVNQVTTAKGTENQRLDQNRVLVTLTRDGGEWRVSKMDAF